MVWHLSCCVSLAASFNAGDALGRVDLGVTNASAVLASGDVQVGNWSESPVSVLEEDVRGDLTGDADLIATDEAGGKTARKDCSTIDGGGWKQVRHVPAGRRWHPARDQLRGTARYGRVGSSTSANAWTVPFNREKFNEFLFATGDCQKWLIARRWSVLGRYANGQRWIEKSSIRGSKYKARWYRRNRVGEDPWVSLEDHGRSWNRGKILYGGRSYANWHAASILPMHEGADVYIRQKEIKVKDCSKVDGGGWKLVRHVPGRMKWHPARDHLKGTAVYGTPSPEPSANPWSIKFDKTPFNEFLFATGDCQRWLIAKKFSVMAAYANQPRWIEKSSQKNSRYQARWYNRWNIPHEPWISVTDHGSAVHSGHILYGENNFGNIHASRVLPNHLGANVWIRNKVVKKSCAHLDGGGWTRVRHVPAGYNWHPATDQLAGTAVYGKQSDDSTAPAWSIKFDKEKFNQFMFATGDCKKWLVAKRYSVLGWYSSKKRRVESSSRIGRLHSLRWTRRKGKAADPKITLGPRQLLYAAGGSRRSTSLLQSHHGAGVYVRQKVTFVRDCSKLMGGGWTLVRHTPAGYHWHPAVDQLRGTASYGRKGTATSGWAWSVPFSGLNFNQFMFATGDCKKWIVSDKPAVLSWYNNGRRDVLKSSSNSNAHKIRWHRRKAMKSDPLITLRDARSAKVRSEWLYLGGGRHLGTSILRNHVGANVFIRMKDVVDCATRRGRGWIHVRHVPAGLSWHPAKDYLNGTATYGKPSDKLSAPAWSIAFNAKRVKEFLFASGDCSQWLVAPRKSVLGWYSGSARVIKTSSRHRTAYKARWYRRKGQWTDPWITTTDFKRAKVGDGNILYAAGGIVAGSATVQHHGGADVFIRY
mmetsp:Transcript_51638/g.117461  ORF Transcript_51638/g.117461 Transcript_51638/m.117461 type:complete len:870 (-) Transcript_51638:80-2689(-)